MLFGQDTGVTDDWAPEECRVIINTVPVYRFYINIKLTRHRLSRKAPYYARRLQLV